MERRLYGPGGYYAEKTGQSGREGDYFTAVEAGEAFGILLAEILVDWQMRSGLSPFNIIEVGAGEGKLASSLGKAFRENHPVRASSFRYIGIERGKARLVKLDKLVQKLPFISEVLTDLVTLPQGGVSGCVLANELIDAFPVHRVRWTNGALQEGFVSEKSPTSIIWQKPSTSRLEAYFKRLKMVLPEGYETEVNLAMADWLKEVGRALHSGIVLLFDYGRAATELYDPERSKGTLRGFKDHRVFSDILATPPNTDITADVDFTSLALDAQAAGFKVASFSEMGSFLLAAVERWTARQTGMAKPPSGLRYLMHPEGMGGAFQAIVLTKGEPFSNWTFPYNRISRLGLSNI